MEQHARQQQQREKKSNNRKKVKKNNKKSEYSKIVHATSLMHSQHIHAMKN